MWLYIMGGTFLALFLFCGIKAAPPKWPTDDEIRERLKKEKP
jgi:hypothetical protein